MKSQREDTGDPSSSTEGRSVEKPKAVLSVEPQSIEMLLASLRHFLENTVAWKQAVLGQLNHQSGLLREVKESVSHLAQSLDRLEVSRESATIQEEPEGADLNLLSTQQAAFSHNLQQVRLLNEGLDAKLDRLTTEFIDREVTEPLFKEFLHIYQAIGGVSGPIGDHGQMSAIADSVERFLEAFGLRIIAPREGESFNPKEHQPLEEQLTQDCARHGLIAGTHQAGLGSSTRVIQPARVAVFIYKEVQIQT